jgi:hypothetical protein
MAKIQREAIKEHQAMRKLNLPGLSADDQMQENLELKQDDIIKERTVGTDMMDFIEYLQFLNGGPLTSSVEIDAVPSKADVELSPLNLRTHGLIQDVKTEIDENWRRLTRIRAQARPSPKEPDGVLQEDAISDATSTDSRLHFNQHRPSRTFDQNVPGETRVLPVIKRRSIS